MFLSLMLTAAFAKAHTTVECQIKSAGTVEACVSMEDYRNSLKRDKLPIGNDAKDTGFYIVKSDYTRGDATELGARASLMELCRDGFSGWDDRRVTIRRTGDPAITKCIDAVSHADDLFKWNEAVCQDLMAKNVVCETRNDD